MVPVDPIKQRLYLQNEIGPIEERSQVLLHKDKEVH